MTVITRHHGSTARADHHSPTRRLARAAGRGTALGGGLLAALALGLTAPATSAWGAPASASSGANPSVLAGPAQPASFCGITWGSLPKVGGTLSPSATLTGVRSGRHECYDRLVVDLHGPVKGYDVRYVPVVRAEGSGLPVPVRGGAALSVVVKAAAYDSSGRPTYTPANPRELTDVTGFRTFRQVAWAGSFEGQSTLAMGVRARLPFRVLIVPGPGTGSRLVVDVAHLW